jgi:D-alanyl-D-alanine carboxypeptidase (penicillin-binding protein 5/6)
MEIIMKRLKKPATAFVAAIIALTLFLPLSAGATAGTTAGATQESEIEISARGAVVIDFETGIALFGVNEAVQRVPASMVKMVAVHVIYDAIRDGRVTFDTRISIRPETSLFSRDMTWSNVPLDEDETYSVRELLEVVIVRSACAATVALGEGIFGSERAFVQQMNAKARELNIRATFADSWGGSPDNRISPLAMAWMASALIRDYPEVLEITSMPTVSFRGSTPLLNSNHLLTRYPGADGMKTGFTSAAGRCLIGTAVRNGRRLITVTMGNSMETRYPDTETLLDFGFANAERIIAERLGGTVSPSAANLEVNGVSRPLSAYNIGGYHYFKLRDVAYLLNGTQRQFEVIWNETNRTIHIENGQPYTPVGGELDIAAGTARRYSPTSSRIFIDGEEIGFDAFFIDGNNYFRLRDIAPIIDFSVEWIDETRTVIIDTSVGYGGDADLPEDFEDEDEYVNADEDVAVNTG